MAAASLNINIGASIGPMQKAIQEVSNLLKNFGGQIAGSNTAMKAAIDKAAAGMDKAMSDVSKSFENFGKSGDDATKKVSTGTGTLRSQLREATNDVARFSAKFGEFSPQALAATQKAGALKAEIGDMGERINAFDPDARFKAFTGVLQGASGAVGAVTGGMQLLGIEGKSAQEAMAKLQAIMAITQGLDAIKGLGDAFGTVKASIMAATAGMSAMKVALVSTGIGALVIGAGALVAYWSDISKWMGLSSVATKTAYENEVKLLEVIEKQVESRKKVYANYDDLAKLRIDGMADEGTAAKAQWAIDKAAELQDWAGRLALKKAYTSQYNEAVNLINAKYVKLESDFRTKAETDLTKKKDEELAKRKTATDKYLAAQKKIDDDWAKVLEKRAARTKELGELELADRERISKASQALSEKYSLGKPQPLSAPQLARAQTKGGLATSANEGTAEDAVSDMLDARITKLSEYEKALAMAAESSKAFETSTKEAFAQTAILVGESIGSMIAGTYTAGDMFTGMMTIVANFAKQLGEQYIKMGIASLVFKKFIIANPAIAIAAGIALVAAGAYLSQRNAQMQTGGISKFADGGIVYGPTVGLMGEYPGASNNPEVVAPLSKLRDMIGGGGGSTQVYGRVAGSDIQISSTKYKRWQNRII